MSEAIRMNAHLRIARNEEGMVSLLVNGEEMNMQVLAGSVTVTFPDDEVSLGTARITMTLLSDDFEIDMPAEVEIA